MGRVFFGRISRSDFRIRPPAGPPYVGPPAPAGWCLVPVSAVVGEVGVGLCLPQRHSLTGVGAGPALLGAVEVT